MELHNLPQALKNEQENENIIAQVIGERRLIAGQCRAANFATLRSALTGLTPCRGLALHRRITAWGAGTLNPRRL